MIHFLQSLDIAFDVVLSEIWPYNLDCYRNIFSDCCFYYLA